MAANPTNAVELRAVSKAFDATAVLHEVSLTVRRGEFLALLGGSGCGKTTLLRIVAGLELPDSGSVVIGGRDMTETAPFARPVNMMFQSYALFPHLSVRDNIEYGLRAGGVPKDGRDALVGWALGVVRLEDLGARKPEQLSGGQRQRVALARCLVKKPDVLLLDEPMAALDRGLREEMQRELVRIQRDVGTTFILVTHDQDEAMSMADRIAVMDAGRIVQLAPPREIYDRPVSRFVARFVGRINLLDGRVVRSAGGVLDIECDGNLRVSCPGELPAGRACAAAIRPEKVRVGRSPSGLAHDWAGVIESLAYFGDMTRAVVRLPGGQALEATLGEGDCPGAPLAIGEAVHAGFDGRAAVVLSE